MNYMHQIYDFAKDALEIGQTYTAEYEEFDDDEMYDEEIEVTIQHHESSFNTGLFYQKGGMYSYLKKTLKGLIDIRLD